MLKRTAYTTTIDQLSALAKLMDSRFKIPGTNIRFGLDSIIGIVPVAGDFAGFFISALMVTVLAKNGASGFLLARMVFNIVIDAVIGSVPVAGDIFDVAFKANQRNIRLMKEHYTEGRHNGSAWKLLIPLLLLLMLLIILISWLSYKIFAWIYKLL